MELNATSATVYGRSMEPTLFEGDLVQLTPVKPEEVRAGAVYSYSDPDHDVSHRCVEAKEGGFLFRGDRQPDAEEVSRSTNFRRVDRVLDRRAAPDPARIVFGLLRHVDGDESKAFPKHTTLYWPWKDIFALARKHRLLTAVAYALKRSPLWQEVPDEQKALFQLDLYQSAERAERISALVGELRRLFPEGRLLKGAALREELFPDPLVRTMADVDLLVPAGEFDAGIELLLANGCTISAEWRECATYFHEATLWHEGAAVEIELHKDIFQPHRYGFSAAAFLRERSDLDELLYLCAHALTHFGTHGLSFWEIYRFLKIRKPDLSRAAERARELRCGLAYAFALRLTRSWWNESFDARAESRLSLRQKTSLAAASFFFLDDTRTELMSTRKRLLQALLADDVVALLRMTFDPDRLRKNRSPA